MMEKILIILMADASSSSLIIPKEVSKYKSKEVMQDGIRRKLTIVENKLWNKSHKKAQVEIWKRFRKIMNVENGRIKIGVVTGLITS